MRVVERKSFLHPFAFLLASVGVLIFDFRVTDLGGSEVKAIGWNGKGWDERCGCDFFASLRLFTVLPRFGWGWDGGALLAVTVFVLSLSIFSAPWESAHVLLRSLLCSSNRISRPPELAAHSTNKLPTRSISKYDPLLAQNL